MRWTAIKPMLPNRPRGVRRIADRRVRDGIVCVLRSGAPRRDLPATYGPARRVTTPCSVDDGLVALICPTCQRSTSGTRRVPATVHGVVFNVLAGSAAEAPPCPSAASGRLRHPTSDEATARGLEPSLYLSSAFSIFTNSPCTNSLPHTHAPFSAGRRGLRRLKSSPASRTVICPAAMSQGLQVTLPVAVEKPWRRRRPMRLAI
jgi:hypothetical protein